jgi:hypothetical protein
MSKPINQSYKYKTAKADAGRFFKRVNRQKPVHNMNQFQAGNEEEV